MFAQTYGSTTVGLGGSLITVEVDIANGLPAFEIVGLPEAAVRESRERVRAAIKNAGYEFPGRKMIINLAPADMKKDSSGLDLPIAVGILAASGQIDKEQCRKYLLVSELSLDGKLRGITGVLPMAITCAEQEMGQMVVAPDNAQEALLVDDVVVYAPESLADLVLHFRGEKRLASQCKQEHFEQKTEPQEDFADVQGQLLAKRALEIAAAGGHNVLMVGPPGSGKTMLAKRIASILPPMSRQEALEVTKIYSVAGMLKGSSGLVTARPFRHPHHTISDAGLIGGGKFPRPGEVTLSHNGILFLDELPEFPRTVLEVLRQPLEDGEVTISRVNASISYPAKSMFIAAMNPCPCGFFGDSLKPCSCSATDIRRYTKKISGPLLDRIDIHVHVPRLEYGEIIGNHAGESSAAIRRRVETARLIQEQRLKKYDIFCNAQMGHKHIKNNCPLTNEAQDMLKQVFVKMNLSARSYDRIIKVSRTIADLSGSQQIEDRHVAEAIRYRGSQGPV